MSFAPLEPTAKLMTQVALRSGPIRWVVWIEPRLAKLGKLLVDEDGGTWKVSDVYRTARRRHVPAEIRSHRRATGDSLSPC